MINKEFRSKLKKAGVSDDVANEVIKAIDQKENESSELAENIRQVVAIYQGQATLGKRINVVLHEGRVGVCETPLKNKSVT